ncbi:pyridoxal-phosphate dependent enzyme [Pseudoalteromonas sp. DL2-H2.2]|uniref:1-aminocyclopropane-1-carboxylate deaminase/D-cysteine desulfhydrase n=1 Tax=Pseudoalteromonas sp. DL2-H2.2 TaxID=2908889 RepID=UPI001F15A0AB|nr:pyridoxal-phosphate dependent enzyme [Pseudoalteromonas sp. DL2-H2.2]MCF2908849.1 pyridoxal-phosphate dependent enzyme [Pseudoalteromonas sp. DL2-H2.2]
MKGAKVRMFESPEVTLNLSIKNCKFKIKRDDLLPDFMGGNKVRKNRFILSSLTSLPDVIITNGGAESNHARVCALMAARLGIKCHLVLHGEKDESDYLHGNKFFIESTNAEINYVNSDEIARTIEAIKRKCELQGLDVFVIPGGGHSLDGARAFIAAVDELEEEPDYIFFPSGTGATHAGLLAGVKKKNWKTQVVGISIARQAERGIPAIDELYAPLCAELNIQHRVEDIIFLEQFTFGGYAKYNAELIEFVRRVTSQTGVPFDPVYSGKALYGVTQLLEKAKIPASSKVLFWHTGGLLNLQSSKAI